MKGSLVGYYTFGGGAAEVATDVTGKVLPGIEYHVWSKASGGVPVTDLTDLDGNPLPNVVTSQTAEDAASPEDVGRIVFKAPDSYPVLFLDAGYGLRWAIMAREVWTQVGTAVDSYGQAIATSQKASDDVTSLTDTVGVLQDTVDNAPGFGFDITALSPEYVTQLRIAPNRVGQSFEKDPITGQFYVAQVGGPNGPDPASTDGDTVIYRLTPTGDVLDVSTLKGGGHGSSIALENVGSDVYVWTWWSSPGGGMAGLYRWKYVGGKTVLYTDAQPANDFEGVYSNVSIDAATDHIAVRSNNGGPEKYVLRKLSEYKNGTDNPLNQVGPTDESSYGPFQGFATIDGYLYVNRGGIGEDDEGNALPPVILRYDWVTGTKTVVDVTPVGAKPDGTFIGNHNEIEGAGVWRGASGKPSLLFGKATGAVGARRSCVYAFTPVGADSLNTETVQNLDRSEQQGTEDITPVAANTPTAYTVQFPWEFATPPTITLTIGSMKPEVARVGWWNVTTTGFTIYLTRTDTTHTYVSWKAKA